jgi:hypothetical protein
MIDLPPIESIVRPSDPATLEGLSAAIAEVLAHLYEYATIELGKLPPDPVGEILRDALFDAAASIDALAKYSSGPAVRSMLGDSGQID